MKAVLSAGVKVGFSFLTEMLKEHQSKFEGVGNVCGVSFLSEVVEGRLLFIQLQIGTWHMSGGRGRARQDWDNTDIVDMKIEMLPKSKFADYMAANNLVLRGRLESSFLVIVIIMIYRQLHIMNFIK